MALFAIADLHLSQSLDKPMDVFGSRWSGYTEKIIENWNKTVSESDTVVVAGDISWGMNTSEALKDLKLLDSLNGRKIIGKGNHDYWWGTAAKLKSFFEKENITTIDILHNNAYVSQNFGICGSRGWYSDEKNAPENADYEKIVAREAGRLQLSIDQAKCLLCKDDQTSGELLAFMHFPPVFRDYVCKELTSVLKANGISRCYYGHIHGVYDIPQETLYDGVTYSIISADYLNFYPYRIEESVNKIKNISLCP